MTMKTGMRRQQPRSSRTPRPAHTLLQTMPAMPIDETVCRGSHHLLCRRYEPAAPLTQPRICLPRRCIHTYIHVCMRAFAPYPFMHREVRTCVSILARRVALSRKRKTRLPAIIESDLIKRRSWECIGLQEEHIMCVASRLSFSKTNYLINSLKKW